MKGQSMLELVIAMGLILAIISAMAVVTLNGLKNSQFSKNQLQATKLAQEGMDRLRTIKVRNYSVCNLSLSAKWNDIWSKTCANPTDCAYVVRSSGSCGTVTDPFWLNNSASPEEITLEGVTFQRRVVILDYGGSLTQKEVTIKVSWTDISGSHESNLATVLTQY